MTTVLSANGSIELPDSVRRRLHWEPGQDFEVLVDEDGDSVTLLPVSLPANQGLVDLLLACHFPFEIPPRDSDDSAPTAL